MSARKGNRSQESAKLRSGDMAALMVVDKKLRTECKTSPEVNKRNLRAMANTEKAEAVANNLLNLAGVIDSEIGMLGKGGNGEVKGLLYCLCSREEPAFYAYLLLHRFRTYAE